MTAISTSSVNSGRPCLTAAFATCISFWSSLVLALLFAPLPAISQSATADETEIIPMLECVRISPETGNYIAVFGYNNPSKTEVSIPPESSSLSCAGVLVTGNNIHVFKPGRVFSAFSVEYECAELTWTVTGPSGKPKSVTANSSSTFCATTGSISPNVTTTTSTPGKTFGKIGSELSILAAGGNIPTDFVYQIEVIGGVRYVFVTLIALEGKTAALLGDVNGMGLLEANVLGLQITGWLPVSKLPDLNSLPNLRLALPGFTPVRNGGAVTSQGDLAQRTDLTRTGFNVKGEGIKIGVLSDSYNASLGNQALLDVQQGDLPGVENPLNPTPVQVLRDLPSGSGLGTDEGRAMLQIIHDVAPKATLAFRTAFNGHLDMAEGIRELKNAGCHLIVDDITYITEPFFQDGVVAQAVDEVAAQGVTYFSAAGNFGVRSYQGQFNPMASPDGKTVHNFSGGDYLQRLYLPEGSYTVAMQWVSDAGHDLDFYLTDDSGGIIIGYNRDGTYPFEGMAFHVSAGGAVANIMVANASTSTGPPPVFKYIIFRGNAAIWEHSSGTSTITGQANAAGAIAVGAVLYSNTPRYGVTPPTIASFSSRGGTPILRDASNGIVNITREKPDFAAPNGGNTTVSLGGVNLEPDAFPNFFGTSAAAPHAAAAAALLLEAHKKYKGTSLAPAAVRSKLRSSALDMGEAGRDNVSGYGFIRPDAAISTFATPTPIAESFVVVGAVAAGSTIKVQGHYFKNSAGGSISQITFDGVAVATTFISETELQAIIPAFTGNPAIRVCSPASGTTIVPDGGCSNALYLFPKTVVTIKVQNTTKRYGDSMPATYAATITNAPASLSVTDLRFTTLATDLSDVGAYVVTPHIRSGHPVLALSDRYEFVYEPGILQIEKIAVEIIPNDLAISEGEPIQGFTYTYSFPVPIANSDDKIQLIRNKLSQAHKVLQTNRVALVTESHLLQLASISNKSFLISAAAEANAAFVYNSSFVINVSSSVLNQIAAPDVNASSVYNATWVMNASFVINSLRVYNSSFVINASSVMNSNTIGAGNNEEAILILNEADEVLSSVYAINLITGYTVGTHLWAPATLLSNNFNASYGLPAIFSVNPKGTGVKAVKPYLECVETNGSGYIAHFWYDNPNAVAVCVPPGADNKLIFEGTDPVIVPGTCIPKIFKPGKHYAFSIAFDGNKCYWSLTSNQGTKRTSIASEASSTSSRCKSNDRGPSTSCTDGVFLSSVSTSSLQSSSPLLDDGILIYPNPVGDNLKIDLQGLGDTEVAITMYDALGRVCLKEKLSNKDALNDISVTNLKPGLYLLKMEYGDVSRQYRIIKQ
ncbi:S8 family serine peptidase [Pontibacter toksunensis]|uniref:S8 family serine peptidase n=1 Tax=Pontibacter toksunensis TaxID=1332631 RepID=A0ABW6C0M4_9BACT